MKRTIGIALLVGTFAATSFGQWINYDPMAITASSVTRRAVSQFGGVASATNDWVTNIDLLSR